MIKKEYTIQVANCNDVEWMLRHYGDHILSVNGDVLVFFTGVKQDITFPEDARLISTKLIYLTTDHLVGVTPPTTAFGDLGARIWYPILFALMAVAIGGITWFLCLLAGLSLWFLPVIFVMTLLSLFIIGQVIAWALHRLAHLGVHINAPIRIRK